MNIDVQIEELSIDATEVQHQYVPVQDLDLMYVGGGGATGVLF